jgi:hypothetical protein
MLVDPGMALIIGAENEFHLLQIIFTLKYQSQLVSVIIFMFHTCPFFSRKIHL